MFIRNGEILKIEKAETETEKWVQSKLSEIVKSNKIYTFKATMKPVILDTDTGIHVDHRFISIPAKTSFINPMTGMNETWQYVGPNTYVDVQKGGVLKVPHVNPFIISTSGEHFKSNVDAEKIFFLMEISKSKSNRKIVIEDKELEAKQDAESQLIEATAKMMILSPDSIISVNKTGSNQALKNIAAYFGVDNLDVKSDDVIKLNLWDKIKFAQANYQNTKKGFNEFIEMANNEGDHEKRSTVMLAINRGVLEFNDSIWFVRMKGGAVQHIVPVPPDKESKKDDVVIRFLINKDNKYFYDLVDESLRNPEPSSIMKSEPKSGLNYAQLKSRIKNELGWSDAGLKGKKQKELERIFANKQRQ